jgi:hypothetical protein
VSTQVIKHHGFGLERARQAVQQIHHADRVERPPIKLERLEHVGPMDSRLIAPNSPGRERQGVAVEVDQNNLGVARRESTPVEKIPAAHPDIQMGVRHVAVI